MIHRQNNVLLTDSDGNPDFAASYTVIALPHGAIASAASSGTTATVDTGHGFAAGDKVLVYDGTTATFVAEAISSVTATTLVWAAATPTIANTDRLCNLGPDTASGSTPAFDASPMFVYTDSAGADVITNSLITCDTTGNYDYWSFGDGLNWELIRDTSGTVAGVVPGWSGVGGRRNVCDYGAVGNNSTDNALRINVTVLAANGSVIWIPGGPNANYRCESQILLNANDKLLGDPDATLVKNWSVAAGVSAAFVANTNVATASDDNIEIGGFRFDLVDATSGGDIIGLWSDNGYIHDLRIADFSETSVVGRAIVARGNNFSIRSVRASTTLDEAGADGIIWTGGTGCVVSDCIVRSGDDAFGCNTWVTGVWANAAASEYTLSNCRAESNNGRMFFCGSGTNAAATSNISNITVNGLIGFGDGGLVRVARGHASSTGTIKNVRISGVVGDGTKNDEAQRSIDVEDVADNDLIEDVHVSNCSFPVSSHASAITAPVLFSNVNRCSIKDCNIDASGQTAAQLYVILAEDCQDIEVSGNTITCSVTDPTGATWAAIQFGSGANQVQGGIIANNTILEIPAGGGTVANVINLSEATSTIVSGNRLKYGSANSGCTAISDQGGTTEGNNVIVGNELLDFVAETPPISSLEEGDTLWANNLGHDLATMETGIVAVNPGVQGDKPLTSKINVVATVGTASDAVTAPAALHAREFTVINNGANTLELWPASGDNLGGGVDTAVTITSGTNKRYVAIDATSWETLI